MNFGIFTNMIPTWVVLKSKAQALCKTKFNNLNEFWDFYQYDTNNIDSAHFCFHPITFLSDLTMQCE